MRKPSPFIGCLVLVLVALLSLLLLGAAVWIVLAAAKLALG